MSVRVHKILIAKNVLGALAKLAVVDEGRLVGIVTDRDLVRRARATPRR